MGVRAAVVSLFLAVICTGCGTSINVVASPSTNVGPVRSAYLVIHETPPNDMDVKVQSALAAHNVAVTTGKEDVNQGTDLRVKYDDKWNWDVAMYLRALELQVFDGRTGALLATSQWSDGFMHGYRDSGKAAADLVTETFKKLGVPVIEKPQAGKTQAAK